MPDKTVSPDPEPEVTHLETMYVTRDRGLATITFNRPEKKNALNAQSWSDLAAVLEEIAYRPDDRAVLLTGAEGNFSSGADLSGSGGSVTNRAPANAPKRPLIIVSEMRDVGDIILRLHRLPKPTIAKVEGVAVGVALGLALGCDLVVAAEDARFIEIFPRRGLALDGGSSWLLPRLVGLQKAKELAFFGESVSGTEAARIGLANRAVPAAELDQAVDEWAHRLAEGPTIALSISKRMLNSSSNLTMEQALENEASAQHISYTTEDTREAMTAFMERRDPQFRGY